MALIKCPECKKEISNKATACPHCGCPIVAKLPKKMKSLHSLSRDEQNAIITYRKQTCQFWTPYRIVLVIILSINLISCFLMIFVLDSALVNTIFWITICIEFIFGLLGYKENKEWYSKNQKMLYEKRILK